MTCADSTNPDQMNYPIENIGVRSDNEGTQGAQSPDSRPPVLTRSDSFKGMVEGIAREIRAEDQRYVLDVLRIYCEHDKRRTAITRTSDDWYKAKISAVTEIAKLFKDHPL